MQKAALLHVVRIDYGGTDRLVELEISFSTLVSHAISGHNGSGVENEASILFNPNPNLKFPERRWESGGVADGGPCAVCGTQAVCSRYSCDCPFHLRAAFVWLIHHPSESVPFAQHGREKQTLT